MPGRSLAWGACMPKDEVPGRITFRRTSGLIWLLSAQFPERPKAAEWRNTIAKKMTPQEVEEAQRLSKESGRYFVGDAMTFPVALNRPLPPYTDEARLARISGTILLQCVVRIDGSANGCEINRGLGYGLDESAINTITGTWRFTPGTFQGKPRDVQAEISIVFRLPERQ